MLRMQQEAVSRVHEYQTRARQTMPFYDVPESAITPYHEPPEPLLFSPDALYPGFSGYLGEPEPPSADRQAQSGASPPQAPSQPASQPAAIQPAAAPADPVEPIRGMLEKLDIDPEIFLILGLIFLLHNEKADNTLLIALGYLLL